jgi:hypothetical protein
MEDFTVLQTVDVGVGSVRMAAQWQRGMIGFLHGFLCIVTPRSQPHTDVQQAEKQYLMLRVFMSSPVYDVRMMFV